MQHSTKFTEKQNSAIVRQTRMTKGDFHISRRSSHADFNIAYSEVKVSTPNSYKSPSSKGKIKFTMSFHDGFKYKGSKYERGSSPSGTVWCAKTPNAVGVLT